MAMARSRSRIPFSISWQRLETYLLPRLQQAIVTSKQSLAHLSCPHRRFHLVQYRLAKQARRTMTTISRRHERGLGLFITHSVRRSDWHWSRRPVK